MSDVVARVPRLSVVMPNFNHGRFLAEAITAIAAQTVPPFEVVVVDDGSTDDSIARLQDMARERPWLRVHRHPENRGVNTACNTGLGLVTGDFVLFSAADDRLCESMVERVSAAAAAHPETGILFSDHATMSLDGATTAIVPLALPKQRRYFSGDEMVCLLYTSDAADE